MALAIKNSLPLALADAIPFAADHSVESKRERFDKSKDVRNLAGSS